MANQLQNKLNQFEVTPPEGVWEKITEALDEASSLTFVQRLQTYEVTPDPANWEKIEAGLPDGQAKNSFFSRHRRLFVYSGAAAVIAAIVVSLTLLTPGKSISNETKGNTLITQSTVEKTPDQAKAEAAIAEVKKEGKDDGHYITVVKNDGKKVKLSKKVLPVYTCATNQVNEHCKKRIARLQNKMANSMVAPIVDFTGIVELVKNLNEDQ